MTANQMVLHTTEGCTRATLVPPNTQLGTPAAVADCAQPGGCVVITNGPASFGEAFNAAGGGVYAAQFDVSGSVLYFIFCFGRRPLILL